MLELGRNLPSGAPAVSRGRSSYLSDASSKVDQRLNNFQEIFTRKFQTKFTKLGDRFRFVDEDKRGALGKVELKRVFEKMSAPVDDAIINKLLNRCENPEEGVTLKEFGALLGNETQPMSLLQNRDPGGNFGDNAKQKFLWVPAKNTKLGSLNDTLEAEKIEKGLLPPRLDLNFSGVRYDIISLGHGLDRTPASVRVPVKNRLALFDPPPRTAARWHTTSARYRTTFSRTAPCTPRGASRHASPPGQQWSRRSHARRCTRPSGSAPSRGGSTRRAIRRARSSSPSRAARTLRESVIAAM